MSFVRTAVVSLLLPPCLMVLITGDLSALAAAPRELIPTKPQFSPDSLTLRTAIRRGIEKNRTLNIQRLALRAADLQHDIAWDTMFMPQASLRGSADSTYSFASIQGRDNEIARDHGYPSTSAELNLGTYTLFNFWRDWITYEQANLDWKRTREAYDEAVRAFQFQVILAYFRLKAEQEKLDSSLRSVQISEAILELVKSRLKRRKATDTDVSSSNVDLLNARSELASRESSERSALWGLNQLLGDPVGTAYDIQDTIRFTPITITQEEAVKIYWEHAPTVKNGKKELRKAELALELTQKNQLPLPTVTFNGVTLSYQNSYTDGVYSAYGQSTSNPNLGIAVSVSLTLPILGPNGFFNHRQVAQSQIARDTAELTYIDSSSREVTSIHNSFAAIKRDESTILNERQVFEQSTTLLDSLFSKLSSENVSRLELRDAITQARNAELSLLESNIVHLNDKLDLAKLIGVDQLPGDQF